MATSETQIYQLKVTLRGLRPPIWRRIQVAGDITLYELHLVLQATMGWANYHLYQFTINGIHYGEPHPDDWYDIVDVRKTRLNAVASEAGSKFLYEYDFGDGWEHEIKLEKILPPEAGQRYPVCITGRRACPPEDCGGVWGYADLLEIIQDPKREEHDEMLEWLGGELDPEAFDLDEINQVLQRSR
ncbi:MAG: plasmid pRiA4b ORF-3 family protein [Anaerolineae bacterium]